MTPLVLSLLASLMIATGARAGETPSEEGV